MVKYKATARLCCIFPGLVSFFLSLSLPSRLGPIKAGPTCLSLTDAVHPEGSPGSCWGWTPAPEDWPAAPTAQATGWGGTTRSGLRLFLHRLFSWVGLCWVLAAAQALLWLRCTAFSSQRLLLSWAAVVAERGRSSCGPHAVERRFNGSDARA